MQCSSLPGIKLQTSNLFEIGPSSSFALFKAASLRRMGDATVRLALQDYSAPLLALGSTLMESFVTERAHATPLESMKALASARRAMEGWMP